MWKYGGFVPKLLCTDCKHSKSTNKGWICGRPKSKSISLVTGEEEVKISGLFCSTERNQSWYLSRVCGYCGEEGRFWESNNAYL